MEENQNIADIGAAVTDMDLQETIRIPQEEENNEIFHDSMTEEQWREQLDAQASGTEQGPQNKETDSRTQLQKDREQEGQEIRTRLQQRWQEQKQRTIGIEQTENVAEGKGRQHPPTHIMKSLNILRRLR